MSEVLPSELTRIDYLRTFGFALVTDVNKHVMDDVAGMTPALLENIPFGNISKYTTESQLRKRKSNVGLMLATTALSTLIPGYYRIIDNESYGITQEDTNGASYHGVFNSGFGDQDFPWHFSAGVASNVVDRLVYGKHLPPDVARNMSLTDWANIINTGWFSGLVHSLAFASNGFYGVFGKYLDSYRHNGLIKHVSARTSVSNEIKLLEAGREVEPLDGYSYLTVSASKPLLAAIRKTMNRDRSIGCPVARHATRLFPGMITEDPHTRNLIALERLTVKGDESADDMVRVTQEYSAIDNSLLVLAKKLKEYDALYGTPRVRHITDRTFELLHEHRPPSAEPYLRQAA